MNQQAANFLLDAARFERSAADLVEQAAKTGMKRPEVLLDLAESQRRQAAEARERAAMLMK